MKEKIKKIFGYNLENFILQHITFVVVFIIGVIWILFLLGNLGIEYALTSTGAIIAFWYGYKRYEQDRYLYHLERLLLNQYSINPIEGVKKLEILYYSKNTGKIPIEIWKYIEYNFWTKFKSDIYLYIEQEIDSLIVEAKKSEEIAGLRIQYNEKMTKKLIVVFSELFTGFNKEYIKYVIDKFESICDRESEDGVDKMFNKIFDSVYETYSKTSP